MMTETSFPKAIPYKQLQPTLRSRWLELQIPYSVLDDLTGLPGGYSAKLLAIEPSKALGRISFPVMVRALCLRLIIVESAPPRRRDADLFCAGVTDYRELQVALQHRQRQLNLPLEKLDRAMGLKDGSAAQLLSPNPTRTLAPEYVEPLLRALRVKLLPVADHEARNLFAGRLVPRRNNFTAFGRKHWRYRRASKRNPRAA